MKYYIYKLVCPIENKIVYIGYTSNWKLRKRDHRCYSKTVSITDMVSWKLMLKKSKLRPIFEIIEEIDNKETAKNREIYWIDHYKDNELFNISPGGDNAHKSKNHISKHIKGKSLEEYHGIEKAKEIREFYSTATKGENNPNFGGKTITPKWRINNSKSNSKTPIIVSDKDNNFIGEFLNSKDCAKFLGVGHSLIRECKSKGWLVRHTYKIQNKTF